jgi:tetratricopeptide (TPR) repeat protein
LRDLGDYEAGAVYGRLMKEELRNNESLRHGLEKAAANYSNAASEAFARRDVNRALAMCSAALEIYEELGDTEFIAGQRSNLGVILYARGDLDDAAEMQHMAYTLYSAVGRQEGIARALFDLGTIYKAKGDGAAACSYWRQSRDVYLQLGAGASAQHVEDLLAQANCL